MRLAVISTEAERGHDASIFGPDPQVAGPHHRAEGEDDAEPEPARAAPGRHVRPRLGDLRGVTAAGKRRRLLETPSREWLGLGRGRAPALQLRLLGRLLEIA